MLIEIKNKLSGEVIFSHEQENNSIKITLQLAIEANANLSGANLSDANLRGANLRDANLSGANLSDADLRGANLSGANLSGAYLSGADLSCANLSCADLSCADLSCANLSSANLSCANLSGAYLSDATYGIATLKNGLTQLLGKYWPVFIFDAHIKIGCQLHSTEEWESFDDERISSMASNALEFWKENKELIMTTARLCQKISGVSKGD